VSQALTAACLPALLCGVPVLPLLLLPAGGAWKNGASGG
jgi:hypothetical protein